MNTAPLLQHLRETATPMTAELETKWDKARRVVEGPGDVWLLVRLTLWCVTLRALKHVVRLDWLVRLVSTSPSAALGASDQQDKLVTLIRWVSRFTRVSTKGPCLERSLVTFRYLTAIGADPHLVLGVAPGLSAASPIRGHAWVVVNGEAIDETSESLEGYQSMVSYDANGTRSSAKL